MTMRVTVNGKEVSAPPGQSVRDLLSDLGLGTRAVAVELNKEVIPRRQHGAARLGDGDVIEIVTLVGGG